MRICIIYDCLFPWTVGGAERWYRNLAEQLAAAGHEVTYLTLRQWEHDEAPQIAGLKVIAVAPRMPLYADGKRRTLPPLRFGIGVLWHLLRHRNSYDWLHTASFPYFSVLAAGLVRPFATFRISVDWHEVWSRKYWREYLGAAGVVGWAVQLLCARVPQVAYAFSELHRKRVKEIGVSGEVTLLTGEYAGCKHEPRASASPPTIVYAGRFIAEKRLTLLVDALALAMRRHSELCATLYGHGPEFDCIQDQVQALGLANRIALPGFVSAEEVDDAMCFATAIVQPSAREGYGMIVVEASARGVPVVVVAGDDNAATELVDDGRNGFIVTRPEPALLADAIQSCISGGDVLRAATRQWYRENEKRLSLSHSLERVVANYSTAGLHAHSSSEARTLLLKESGRA